MVTFFYEKYMGRDENGAKRYYKRGHCDSSDTKPTDGIFNGSELKEIDTGKKCAFNQKTQAWEEQPSGGSDYPAAEGEEF